jgi:transposase
MGSPENVEFVRVGVIDGSADHGPAMLAAPDPEPSQQPLSDGKAGTIEITLRNGIRVCVDASVNEKALSRVLRAMKGCM